MIAIIDYGMGNVRAFANVYHKLNMAAVIVNRPGDLKQANKLILPGVGSFDFAMQALNKSGMRQHLDEMVLEHHVPVLGICVGMQMLACSSEEGILPGLGWIDGEVKKFVSPSVSHPMRIPHMGWNDIKVVRSNGLLLGIDHDVDARFYFLHSYYFDCHRSEDPIAVTDYYGEFDCAVNFSNIYGVQFHPEKSHQWGAKLLENFAKL